MLLEREVRWLPGDRCVQPQPFLAASANFGKKRDGNVEPLARRWLDERPIVPERDHVQRLAAAVELSLELVDAPAKSVHVFPAARLSKACSRRSSSLCSWAFTIALSM